MKNLNITVANKVATYCQRDGIMVCGNSDYQITFAFDSDWSAHIVKTARFKWNGTYTDVVFEGNVVNVPIISNTSQVDVGVFAGDICTTTPAVIPCARSILCGEGAPDDPTPDVYSQIIEMINDGIDVSGGITPTMYLHKYTITLNDYTNCPYATIEFILYSTLSESMENRQDFVYRLRSAVYKPFVVYLEDSYDGRRYGKTVSIYDDGRFNVYHEVTDSSEAESFITSTYTVNSVEIMEA